MAKTKVGDAVAFDINVAAYNMLEPGDQNNLQPPARNDAQAFGQSLIMYPAIRNKFFLNMFNLIIPKSITTTEVKDPLLSLRKGVVPLGGTLQLTHIDIEEFKPIDECEDDLADLFSRKPPRTATTYINIDKIYQGKISVSDEIIRTSYVSWEQVGSFLQTSLESLYQGARLTEYLKAKRMIAGAISGGYMWPIVVPDPEASDTDAKSFIKIVKSTASRLTFANNKYNISNVYAATPKSLLKVLITPEISASVGVDVLALAFNIEYTDFVGDVIEVDDMGGAENLGAVMVAFDERWYHVHDHFRRYTDQYSANRLFWNYFYSVRQYWGWADFRQAVVFTKTAPTVTAYSIPETLTCNKCDYVHIPVTATGTGIVPLHSSFTIAGNTSQRTQMLPNNYLYVAPDETATEITVTATSKFDTTKTADCTVTVAPAIDM